MSFANPDANLYGLVNYSQEEKILNLLKRYEPLINKRLAKKDKKKYFAMLDALRKALISRGYNMNKSYIFLVDYPIYAELALVMMLMRDDTRASYNFMSAQEMSEIWWQRRGLTNPSVTLEESYMGIMDVNQEVVNIYFGDIAYKMGKNYKIDSIVSEFISRRMYEFDTRYGRKAVTNVFMKCSEYELRNWPLYEALSNLTKDVTNFQYVEVMDLNGVMAETGFDKWFMGEYAEFIPHLHDVSCMSYDISTKEDEEHNPNVVESRVPIAAPKEDVNKIGF